MVLEGVVCFLEVEHDVAFEGLGAVALEVWGVGVDAFLALYATGLGALAREVARVVEDGNLTKNASLESFLQGSLCRLGETKALVEDWGRTGATWMTKLKGPVPENGEKGDQDILDSTQDSLSSPRAVQDCDIGLDGAFPQVDCSGIVVAEIACARRSA